MSSDAHTGETSTQEPLANVPAAHFDVLQHPRRLTILEELARRGDRRSLDELTVAVLDRSPDGTDSGRSPREVRTSLVHNHLPRLEDCGVVEWDPDVGAELDDSFPLEAAHLSSLLEFFDTTDGAEIFEAVVHPVRLQLCSILADAGRPSSLDRLAGELAGTAVVDDADRAAIELHHIHLPALEAAGVLEYDADSRLVRRTDRSIPASL